MAFSLRAPFPQDEMVRFGLDKLARQRELPGREVRQYATRGGWLPHGLLVFCVAAAPARY